jgi:pimeloyl-ACP methyl ester carboxylesterase
VTEKEFGFHNRRGERLAGVLSLPDGEGAFPGVLLVQGFSGVKNLVLPEVASAFAARGLASLRFDYSGFGESEGPRGWLDPIVRVDDARCALGAFAAAEAVRPDELGIYGHSYGGPVAIHVASLEPRIRAVAAVSAVGDGDEALRGLRPSWEWIEFKERLRAEREAIASGREPTVVDLEELMPFGPVFAKAYAKLKAKAASASGGDGAGALGTTRFYLASAFEMMAFRPTLAASRVTQPLLMVHGELDDAAPVETVTPVFANARGEKRLEVLAGLGHIDLDVQPGLGRALSLAGEWLEPRPDRGEGT